MPTKGEQKKENDVTLLIGPDGKDIKRFVKKNLKLNFGTGKTYDQEFWIADVTSPILGTDFFMKYDLTLDIKRQLLIDRGMEEVIEATKKGRTMT